MSHPLQEQASSRLPVTWSPRAEPLAALAVAAVGPVSLALARRALGAEGPQLGAWHGVAGAGVLILLGATESLPWVDGAVYLGRDPAAPSLLLPCARAARAAGRHGEPRARGGAGGQRGPAGSGPRGDGAWNL